MAPLSRSLLKHLCVKSIIKYFQHKIMLQPVAYLTKNKRISQIGSNMIHFLCIEIRCFLSTNEKQNGECLKRNLSGAKVETLWTVLALQIHCPEIFPWCWLN